MAEKNIGQMTLREIGMLIGQELPQKIKHHLTQLEMKGLITIDKKNAKISRVSDRANQTDFLISIPILGSADCGPASFYADQNIEGYLKISKRLVPDRRKLYALKAKGHSMDQSDINGKSIEPGDFVIVDSERISPVNGDYVVSIIDGMANVKKYQVDKKNNRIALISESSQNHLPIFIHEEDDFRINGKVIDVVKKI
jgi:SOS-response transcriptional repressor LexA